MKKAIDNVLSLVVIMIAGWLLITWLLAEDSLVENVEAVLPVSLNSSNLGLEILEGEVSSDLLYVDGLLAEISQEERLIILGYGSQGNNDIELLLASDDVPYIQYLRKTPCRHDSLKPSEWAKLPSSFLYRGSANYVTQLFYWELGMYYKTTPGYHPGVDIVCGGQGSADTLFSPTDMLVISRYYIDPALDTNTIRYWSSGVTLVGKTNIPTGFLNPEILYSLGVEKEYISMLLVIGHMGVGGDWPGPGTLVRLGDPVGYQGSTGNSSGAHVHYAWFIELADGSLYAVDPLTAFVNKAFEGG